MTCVFIREEGTETQREDRDKWNHRGHMLIEEEIGFIPPQAKEYLDTGRSKKVSSSRGLRGSLVLLTL